MQNCSHSILSLLTSASFAEIAIGIIVGCLPVLPRFFKHLASKEAGSPSKFEDFSSASRTLWRRVFRKFPKPELSKNETSYHNRKFLSRQKPSVSSRTPYIETLNLTRNSLQLAENHFPRLPSPARDKGSSAAAPGKSTIHDDRDEDRDYKQNADVEKATSAEWV